MTAINIQTGAAWHILAPGSSLQRVETKVVERVAPATGSERSNAEPEGHPAGRTNWRTGEKERAVPPTALQLKITSMLEEQAQTRAEMQLEETETNPSDRKDDAPQRVAMTEPQEPAATKDTNATSDQPEDALSVAAATDRSEVFKTLP